MRAADLLGDLGGVDRRIHAAVDGEDQIELLEIGFDRRLHVGILQLAGQRGAVMRPRAMHLAERCRRGRMMLEVGEFLLPVRPELGDHTPLHERPAHRRRLALQLAQLFDIFRRQRIRDGGHELRHLHDRSLEAAERRGKLHGVAAAVEGKAEEPRPGDPCRHAAHIGADPRIAGGTGGEAVAFGIGHASEIVRRHGQSEAAHGHRSAAPPPDDPGLGGHDHADRGCLDHRDDSRRSVRPDRTDARVIHHRGRRRPCQRGAGICRILCRRRHARREP